MSVKIKGSKYIPTNDTSLIGKLNDDHQITTTWILNNELTDDELNNFIIEFTQVSINNNLSVSNIDKYHYKVTGNPSDYNNLLQVNLQKYEKNNILFNGASKSIKIPNTWENKINNILGLNNDKIAKPYFHVYNNTRDLNSPTLKPFTPPQLASLYNFPVNLTGTGQKVGIIELGGGYTLSDITTYLSNLNINTVPNITDVSVDGGINNPNDDSGANIEVLLDIEIIASIAPNGLIRVYFAPNSTRGFYDAINQAINDGCKIISISWGAPEVFWTTSSMNTYNNLFRIASNNNVNIFVASGDNGSSDGTWGGNNVDFPSSSQYVVGCGGTCLISNNNTTITQETVWNNNPSSNATGGGVSRVFSKPVYQYNTPNTTNNFRGVPDVAGNADPNTGYIIYGEGGNIQVGGTSAVAPLWSGLMCLINQSIGSPVNYLNQVIYFNPSVCRDIIVGNNGGFAAQIGWDSCTGNGSPNGQRLLNLLSHSSSLPVVSFTQSVSIGQKPLTIRFSDMSTNSPNQWLWSFGDNTTSTQQNPVHVYTQIGNYSVTLMASNSFGSNGLTRINCVTVNPSPIPPVTDFTATPMTGSAPLVINFTDNSTNNPTGWRWNFGDKSPLNNSQNPIHTYQNIGRYSVTLTSSNTYGSNSLTKTNFINVTQPLIASFTSSTQRTKKNTIVAFTNTSTGSPTSYLWDFGDGGTSNLHNPTHVYADPKTYNVRLTVTNETSSNTMIKSKFIVII